MNIYTEITPNPASIKFVTETTILPNGTADFPSAETAGNSPLATKLFLYPFIQGVFIGRNFVTITKSEPSKWEDIIPVVKDTLKQFFQSGIPVIEGQTVEETDETEDEIVKKIKFYLEEHVRPAVAMDGGDIIFEGFEEGTVRLKLMGSCNGCPSSTMTLKAGIQGLLTRMIPEVKSVEAI